ncbi:MAG TPA: DUF3662 and FHA domain-containing protein [Acidimicrobiales bacterium]
MGLRNFENRLERLVEGTFSRVFKSTVRPVELGRRMVREMDAKRSIGVSGKTVAPNEFTIRVSPTDHEQLEPIHDSLVRELCDTAREHARDEGYSFLGPITVDFEVDPSLHTGIFQITARLAEVEGGAPVGSLVLPNGQRVVLGEYLLTIGRLPECTITLNDPNVSRRHAEIRPSGTGYRITDLGSTNGTFVNGRRIHEHQLVDGDVLTFGSTEITFVES